MGLDVSENGTNTTVSCDLPKWLVTCNRDSFAYIDNTIDCTLSGNAIYKITDATSSNLLRESWTFNSRYFGYGFSLPEKARVENDCIDGDSETCSDIYVVADTLDNSPFGVEILEIGFGHYSDPQYEEEDKRLFDNAAEFAAKLRAANFAETKGQPNFNPNLPNKDVGEVRKINFAGNEAYSFTLIESFTHVVHPGAFDGYTLHLPSEYIILKYKGRILIIRKAQNEMGNAIADTFFLF